MMNVEKYGKLAQLLLEARQDEQFACLCEEAKKAEKADEAMLLLLELVAGAIQDEIMVVVEAKA